ncbi:IS110 family transposase [Streptomyces sp. NPDC029526]|uniref:IS110 family transposase n=1 Tax=Streptomyces sp. NPDC029526 TaxID=3155728 RepID=UPI0033EBDD47
MFEIEDVGVFLGLDVGKTAHHGHGLTPAGKKVFDKPLPSSEPKLRAAFDKPAGKCGTVLVIVDQPASIGALPLTVARDAGCQVAYLPGLAMRRIADLYPGEAKTDAREAAVIADAARTMPHTLRSLELTPRAGGGLRSLREAFCGGDSAQHTAPDAPANAQLRKHRGRDNPLSLRGLGPSTRPTADRLVAVGRP